MSPITTISSDVKVIKPLAFNKVAKYEFAATMAMALDSVDRGPKTVANYQFVLRMTNDTKRFMCWNRAGHKQISMVRLPNPMTGDEAVEYLKTNEHFQAEHIQRVLNNEVVVVEPKDVF